jgi:hypothetical protein
MNWFERYGIPGLYFVLLVATACYIFGPPCDKDTAIQIFIAALSASLPIGYILVVTSQWLYYKVPCLQVHHKAWKAAKKDADKELPEDEEWWVEARATVLGRWRISNEDRIEKGKWLQEWFAKRFDVLAINSALILATVFGLLALIIMWRLRFSQVSSPDLDFYRRWALIAFIGLSILAIAVLVLSNNLLKKQARYVATEYYKDLRKKEAKTQTSSSHNHVNGIPHLER